MKLTTNIILTGNQGSTQSYIVQLTPTLSDYGEYVFGEYDKFYGRSIICPSTELSQLIKEENNWKSQEITGSIQNIHKANLRLYFPQYSIDTFDNGITYILSATTYVHGVEMSLGNFVVKRRDALACEPVRFNGMDEYYEYMDFPIADPYSIHFSRDGEDIREELGEQEDFNAHASILYICLYPVNENAEGYVLREDWGSGQNSLAITNPQDISLHIDFDPQFSMIHCGLDFIGKDEGKSITEYFHEAYNSDNTSMIWDCVFMDKDNVYFTVSDVSFARMNSFDPLAYDISFSIEDIADGDTYMQVGNLFQSWSDFKYGIFIQASVSFVHNLDEEEFEQGTYVPYMTVFSNRIPVTQEIFGMLIKGSDFPGQIDLDSLTMQEVKLNVINQIIKNVTAVTPNDSTKSHLIQPVFFQTRELNSITVHPSVTENIAINLDSYKSQADRFKLQIEGIVFNEIGRTGKGIIFKVYGNMLPKNNDSGVMYILDQNNELVTTGKYNYIY